MIPLGAKVPSLKISLEKGKNIRFLLRYQSNQTFSEV